MRRTASTPATGGPSPYATAVVPEASLRSPSRRTVRLALPSRSARAERDVGTPRTVAWESEDAKAATYGPRGRYDYNDLMRAAAAGDMAKVKQVVRDAGGDVLFANDAKGRTALDWARMAGHHDVVASLQRAMDKWVAKKRRQLEYTERVRQCVALLDRNARLGNEMRVACTANDMDEMLRIANTVDYAEADVVNARAEVEAARKQGVDVESLWDGPPPSSPATAGAGTSPSGAPPPLPPPRPTSTSSIWSTSSVTSVRRKLHSSGEAQDVSGLRTNFDVVDLLSREDGKRHLNIFAYPLNAETREGWTPLTRVGLTGNAPAAMTFLLKGASPNYETRLGQTPLTWACHANHTAVVALLMDNGADPFYVTRSGDVALNAACRQGSVESGTVMIEAVINRSTRKHVVPKFDRFVREKEEKEASFGKASPKACTPKPKPNQEVVAESPVPPALPQPAGAEEAASGSALAMLSESSGLKPSGELELASIPKDDAATELKRLLEYRDPKGLTAFDYAKLGDVLQEAKDRDTAKLTGEPPGGTRVGVVTTMLQNAANRLQHRHDAREIQKDLETSYPCRNKCGWKGPRAQRFSHEWLDCTKRQVKCELNCGLVLLVGDMARHMRFDCPNRVVPCKRQHLGCDVIMPIRKLVEHEAHGCHYRGISCPLECGVELRQDQKNDHLKHRCRMRIIECAACGDTMQARHWRHHWQHFCIKRLVKCTGVDPLADWRKQEAEYEAEMRSDVESEEEEEEGAGGAPEGTEDTDKRVFGCGEFLPADDMLEHITHHCANRPLPCRWCGTLFAPPERRITHENFVCGERPVMCKLGCQTEHKAQDLEAHMENDCRWRLVPCHLGCGAQVMYKDRPYHERRGDEGVCPNRATLCHYDLVEKLVTLYPPESLTNDQAVVITLRASSVLGDKAADKQLETVLQEQLEAGVADDAPVADSGEGCGDENDGDGDSDGSPGDSDKGEYVTRGPDGGGPSAKPTQPVEGTIIAYDAATRRHRLRVTADDSTFWFSTTDMILVPKIDQRWRCGATSLLFNTLDPHLTDECKMRPVRCRLGCGSVVRAEFMQVHTLERCPARVVRCSLGCGEPVEEGKRWYHEANDCPNRTTMCDCGEFMTLPELGPHKATACPMIMRFCPNSCGQKVYEMNRVKHMQFDCPKRTVVCPDQCGDSMWAEELDDHRATKCKKRLVKCDQGCGELVPAFELAKHKTDTCRLRPLLCRFGCGVRLPEKLLDVHEDLECEHRMVDCSLGCGETMPYRDREAHELLMCVLRKVPCKYKCGAEPTFKQLVDHQENKCPRRPVSCPRNCMATLWAQDLDHHLHVCPRRLLVCSAVSQSFETDVLHAGRNGRSVEDLTALLRDDILEADGHGGEDSSDGEDGEFNADEVALMATMNEEDRHAFKSGKRKMLAKDRIISTSPNTSLAYCIKELSDWVVTPVFAIPHLLENGTAQFPQCVRHPRLDPLQPGESPTGTREVVRMVRRVGAMLYNMDGTLCDPSLQPKPVHFSTGKQLDGFKESKDPVKAPTTYVDAMDVKLARPKRRRGGVLYSASAAKELSKHLVGIQGGALIRQCVAHGDNPLIRAINQGNLALVATIAKAAHPIGLDCETHYGQTALTLACRLGNQQIAEVLIDQGADINKETSRALTPLTEAARGNHAHIVEMLLNRRVDVPHKTRLRFTAAKIASINNNKEIHSVLSTREILEGAHAALLRAIMCSDVESVRNMVKEGESYRLNHVTVLERRLVEVEAELERKEALEVELQSEVDAANARLDHFHIEMHGEGWDKVDTENTLAFGGFKQVIERPPTPNPPPRGYRGTQGALRMSSEELSTTQADIRYLRHERKSLKERLWCAQLQAFRSRTGHTALCLAAAVDHQEIVDVLYTHGATLGPDDDILNASADLIRAAWMFYVWKTSLARRNIASVVLRFARDMMEMLKLLVVLRRRRTVRRSSRLPVSEALYNGARVTFEYMAHQDAPLHLATYVKPMATIPRRPMADGAEKRSAIIAEQCEPPLSPEELCELAVEELGAKAFVFGEGWKGSTQEFMKGDLKYALGMVNATGKHTHIAERKKALRLAKEQQFLRDDMFAAMAVYDWETVLRCIEAGLNPNDEDDQGHSVMSFSAERAAYVSFGFLRGIYGPRYRPPRWHSTSITRDNEVGKWFGERLTGEFKQRKQYRRDIRRHEWGLQPDPEGPSRMRKVDTTRLERSIIDGAQQEVLMLMDREDPKDLELTDGDKARVEAALSPKPLPKPLFPSSPPPRKASVVEYGVTPRRLIAGKPEAVQLVVKPRRASVSGPPSARSDVVLTPAERMAEKLRGEVPPLELPSGGVVQPSVDAPGAAAGNTKRRGSLPVLSPTSGLLDPQQVLLHRRARALGLIDGPVPESLQTDSDGGVLDGQTGPEQAAIRRRRRASSVVMEEDATKVWKESQELIAQHRAKLMAAGVSGTDLEDQLKKAEERMKQVTEQAAGTLAGIKGAATKVMDVARPKTAEEPPPAGAGAGESAGAPAGTPETKAEGDGKEEVLDTKYTVPQGFIGDEDTGMDDDDSLYLPPHLVTDDLEILVIAVLMDRSTSNKPSLNCATSLGFSALARAAEYGRLHVLEAILARGANINFQSHVDGSTALMRAGARGKMAAVQYLLEKGAEAFLEDHQGRTAVDWAESFPHVQHKIAAYGYGNLGEVVSSLAQPNPVHMCKHGCGAFLPNRALTFHEREGCPKRPVVCGFGCGITGLWAEELVLHQLKECPNRQFECFLGCGNTLYGRDQKFHEENECVNRIVPCWNGCSSKPRPWHVMKEHCDDHCINRKVPCPQQCGQMIHLLDMKAHKANDCPERYVRCRLGCDKLLPARAREEHEENLCFMIRKECKWGCGESIPQVHLATHEETMCDLRPVVCPDGCGQELVVRDLRRHAATECPYRWVPCDNGCGLDIRKHQQAGHDANDCPLVGVQCPLGCGHTDLRKRIYWHRDNECELRLVPCGLGCGARVRLVDVDNHKANECPLRKVACRREGCTATFLEEERNYHEKYTCRERDMYCRFGCGEVLHAREARAHELRSCPLRFVTCKWEGCGEVVRARDLDAHMATCTHRALDKTSALNFRVDV